jgi:hypothetical protein
VRGILHHLNSHPLRCLPTPPRSSHGCLSEPAPVRRWRHTCYVQSPGPCLSPHPGGDEHLDGQGHPDRGRRHRRARVPCFGQGHQLEWQEAYVHSPLPCGVVGQLRSQTSRTRKARRCSSSHRSTCIWCTRRSMHMHRAARAHPCLPRAANPPGRRKGLKCAFPLAMKLFGLEGADTPA